MTQNQRSQLKSLGFDRPLNDGAVSNYDRYIVVNLDTKRAVESHATLPSAEYAARVLQDHAERYGQGLRYTVVELERAA